jgi:hypothetical protein
MMIRRCEEPKASGYERYGGRGIRVCERWRNSLEKFAKDVGPRPSSAHTLDRMDGNGHYEPGNCRWATKREQSHNRRDNRLITANGRTQCLGAWAAEVGASSATIHYRLKAGWDPERAVTTPIRSGKRKLL